MWVIWTSVMRLRPGRDRLRGADESTFREPARIPCAQEVPYSVLEGSDSRAFTDGVPALDPKFASGVEPTPGGRQPAAAGGGAPAAALFERRYQAAAPPATPTTPMPATAAAAVAAAAALTPV